MHFYLHSTITLYNTCLSGRVKYNIPNIVNIFILKMFFLLLHIHMILLTEFCSRCMAGHSQWQNRRHVKGDKDAQRALLIERLMNNIRTAVRGRISSLIHNNQYFVLSFCSPLYIYI